MQSDHQAHLEETAIAELMALSAFESASGSLHDIRRIEFMVKVARELGRDGIGPEVLPLCAEILRSTTLDFGTLRELLAMHDQQRKAASAAQYLRAMSRIK
ncbi:MAG TPA: hypothetical protein PKH72_12270 [Rhodoferax sp.]|jgi:hypothetical protein|nr:hypothetical protein [Rhodoferax sp.]